MRKKNRETAREKVDSVEEDYALGPIVREEIFSQYFGADAPDNSEANEVHIVVCVYKFRVYVEQYDTCDQVWCLFGDGFHEIHVGISRWIIDKKLNTHDPKAIAQIIKKRFDGPYAAHKFAAFCRSTAEEFTIRENGPQRANLIRRMYSDPIGDLCLGLYFSKV